MSGIDIAALRRMVTTIEGNDPQGSFANQGQTGFGRARSFTLGLAGADAAFPHGLAGDALHEVLPKTPARIWPRPALRWPLPPVRQNV